MAEQELATPAWRMMGLRGTHAGLLMLADGVVSFLTPEGPLFEAPVAELKNVKWPALQFGYGFEAEVNGEKYKLTFMKPNGAVNLDDSFLASVSRWNRIGRGVDAMFTLAKAGESKRSAKQWREVVGG